MATITFKKGSAPHTLHAYFTSGKSLTYDEAYAMGIRHLTQRIADLNKKFEDAKEFSSPLMVIEESNNRGGFHTRYFYKGCGSLLEKKAESRKY